MVFNIQELTYEYFRNLNQFWLPPLFFVTAVFEQNKDISLGTTVMFMEYSYLQFVLL